MAKKMHDTPMLDQLEGGPWPSFVTGLKRLAKDKDMMVDLLGQESVQTRPRCATLALGTLKAAVKKYRRDRMLSDVGSSDDLDDDTLGIVTGQAAEEQRGRGLAHD